MILPIYEPKKEKNIRIKKKKPMNSNIQSRLAVCLEVGCMGLGKWVKEGVGAYFQL